jgi:Cu2+-exporting ATPase
MMIRDFRKRFYITLILSLPVLAAAELIQDLLGYSFSFTGMSYLVFVFASVIFFYGGWPFLKGLFTELKDRNPGMMTLIALAISVAYLYSTAVTFGLEGTPFYWELASLIAIMLAGHWIEMASVLSASSALEELAKLMPSQAHKKTNDGVEDVSLDELSNGDLLLIRPGEKIPADGEIKEGESHINESMLTGESKPVRKGIGDKLIGGSINGDGSLTLKIDGIGEDAYLSKIIAMVREAQAAKSKTQLFSDRAAFYLTLIAITVGAATLISWIAFGFGLQFAITRMATVMIITCPHALGLAIPLVVSVSTSKSAQHGLLIRNRTAFEQARNITSVVFDKTGTLTEGSFSVTELTQYGGVEQEEVLRLAAAVELSSEHPIGKSITAYAEKQKVKKSEAQDSEAIKGRGIKGKVDGSEVLVVSPGYLEEQNIKMPEVAKSSGTRVFVLKEGELIGSILLSDTIRPESKKAIKELQASGIRCLMLTGDNEQTAAEISEELGMDGYFAQVLPDEKQDKIKELQSNGEFVAMTGDGVNDSPALAQADVGIAIGSGTDVAASTADIVLVNSNPEDVSTLISFGRRTYSKMVQNLIWATGYNLIAIPLAAGILYPIGILLSPEIGAILMSLSTVIVAVNARLLRVRKED